MGVAGHEAEVLARLTSDPRYVRLFARAFPGETPGIDTVVRAIASFERTLISGRSAFDRYVFDDERTALSSAARAGMALFYSQRVGCAQCHFGINFSGPVLTSSAPTATALYANTALYNVDGSGRYPDTDRGVEQDSRRARDHGKFRVPGLRNVAMTAPYMHDGSIATLAGVIDHYAAGGRQVPLGPAKHNRHRDARLKPLDLSADERRALVAFLESLTDDTFLHDPRFAAPAAATMANER
jgi:cytochrome c peroxidase